MSTFNFDNWLDQLQAGQEPVITVDDQPLPKVVLTQPQVVETDDSISIIFGQRGDQPIVLTFSLDDAIEFGSFLTERASQKILEQRSWKKKK